MAIGALDNDGVAGAPGSVALISGVGGAGLLHALIPSAERASALNPMRNDNAGIGVSPWTICPRKSARVSRVACRPQTVHSPPSWPVLSTPRARQRQLDLACGAGSAERMPITMCHDRLWPADGRGPWGA